MDTLDDDTGDGDFVSPSRFRFIGRSLGYTQTEIGFRTITQIMNEADDWQEVRRSAGKGTDPMEKEIE